MSDSLSKTSYAIHPTESQLVDRALRCLEKRFRYHSDILNNSQDVSAYLRLHLADERNEVFAVIFLNNHHRLIAFEKLFFGTINETTVYARVVVQKALEHNAAKLIFAHNHPSGDVLPSSADKRITRDLQQILSLINVTVNDHFIVTHKESYSFANHGLM